MNSQVLINRTDMDGDYTIVYFTVPSLNIDSQIKVSNDDFIKQVGIGGYVQLGLFLLQQLDDGIQNILNGVSNNTKTTTLNEKNLDATTSNQPLTTENNSQTTIKEGK